MRTMQSSTINNIAEMRMTKSGPERGSFAVSGLGMDASIELTLNPKATTRLMLGRTEDFE